MRKPDKEKDPRKEGLWEKAEKQLAGFEETDELSEMETAALSQTFYEDTTTDVYVIAKRDPEERFDEEPDTTVFESPNAEDYDDPDTESIEDTYETYEPEEDELEEEELPENRSSISRPVILIVSLALLLLAALLILAKVWFSSINQQPDPVLSESSEKEYFDSYQKTGVITWKNEDEERISVYSAEDGAEEENAFEDFLLSDEPLITDQFGQKITFSDLNVGMVVDVSYLKSEKHTKIDYVRISAQAREYADLSGIKVLSSEKKVVLGSREYRYDSQLYCVYQGKPFSVNEVRDNYVVDACVVGDHLYSLIVLEATGRVDIYGTQKYEGASIRFTSSFGVMASYELKDLDGPIELTEGHNSYKVMKEQETLLTGTVFIQSGRLSRLTLPDRAENEGTVSILTIPEDLQFELKIDGKKQSEHTFSVENGEHELEISANGYETKKEPFFVTQPFEEIRVELTATTSTVTVRCALDSVSIICDGKLQGTGMKDREVTFTVTGGTHELEISRKGYQSLIQTLDIDLSVPQYIYYFAALEKKGEESSSESRIDSTQESVPEEPSESGEESEPEESSESGEESSGLLTWWEELMGRLP